MHDIAKTHRIKFIITMVITIAVIVSAAAVVILKVNGRAREADRLKEEGNEYYRREEYSRAEMSYRAVIAAGTDDAEPYLNLGRIYILQGDTDSAVSVWEAGYKRTQSPLIDKELVQYRQTEEDNEADRSVLTVDLFDSPKIDFDITDYSEVFLEVLPEEVEKLRSETIKKKDEKKDESKDENNDENKDKNNDENKDKNNDENNDEDANDSENSDEQTDETE